MRELKTPTTRGHLYRVANADSRVKVLMRFLARAFVPREPASQNLALHVACMCVGSCAGILFPLPRHVHKFVRGIKVQDLVEEICVDPVLCFMAVRHLEELDCAVDSCLGCYH